MVSRPREDEPIDANQQRTNGLEGEIVAGDDRIIARAVRISLVVFLMVGAAITLTIFVMTPRTEEVVVDEAPLVLPQTQERRAEPPAVTFTDITRAAAISFVHESGARGDKLLPETMGPGCAFFDYDGDRDPDILFVNSMHWPDGSRRDRSAPTMALYRNDGSHRFTDVTRAAGLAVPLYGMGVAVGDYDNDGHPDLFVTAVGENHLFRNVGGSFKDVTREAGIAGSADEWSTSAGFFDYDNDGDLDLFVCNYVRWSREIDDKINYQLVGVGKAYGPPTNFEGTQPYFYRNEADGSFEEVAEEIGLHVENAATGLPVAKALALVPFDFDRDGWLDIMVANDTVQNFLYRNLRDGTFREVSSELGVAYDSQGNSTGAMGVDAAFFQNSDIIGIGVGNFATEMSSLYVSGADLLLFSDEAINEGIGPVSRQLLSFGLFFFDYDLDGRLDLFQTNGHLEEEINTVQPSQHYRQPSQLFWNCGPGFQSTFVPVDGGTTGDLARPIVGRGAAYADIDGDGDLDLLITQTGGAPLLLRNDQTLGNHWLRLRLVGRESNRDGIGAVVEVETERDTQRQQVMPTRSYLSQVEPVLTFGLGTSPSAIARVFWPGRSEPQNAGRLSAGTEHVIEQSSAQR